MLSHAHSSTQAQKADPFSPYVVALLLVRQEMKGAVSSCNKTVMMKKLWPWTEREGDGNAMIQRTEHSHNLINTRQRAVSTTRIENNPTLFVAHTCIYYSCQSALSSPISQDKTLRSLYLPKKKKEAGVKRGELYPRSGLSRSL